MVPGEGEGHLALPGAFLLGPRRFLLSPAAGFGGGHGFAVVFSSSWPDSVTRPPCPTHCRARTAPAGARWSKSVQAADVLGAHLRAQQTRGAGGGTAAITPLGLGHKSVPFSHAKSQPSQHHPPRNCLRRGKPSQSGPCSLFRTVGNQTIKIPSTRMEFFPGHLAGKSKETLPPW